MDDKTSYRAIFKATSLFGGVQVINILIQIIRSKLIAVLLGPAGMGMAGLFITSLGLVSGLTNFGLGISAVKNISEAHGSGNKQRMATVVTVMQRILWITGLVGTALAFIFAPLLSTFTFGNENYTVGFRWLSVTMLINQLTSGNNVILQGTRHLKLMAKANVVGSFTGLLFSAPLYYFYSIDGIVPAIVLSSILSLIISWYFSRHIITEKISVTPTATVIEGKSMLKMGFVLGLSSLITVATSYIIRAFISRTGTLEDVGLYSAGFSIIGSYVGLIFTAMGTDYYPRLSAVSSDKIESDKLINQQALMALLIIGPILCAFLVFSQWTVIMLYSVEFLPVTGLIKWAALGMYFKSAAWAVGFIFLAKGSSKIFFWSELITSAYVLALNLGGYALFGLDGLGISFLITYFLAFLQVYFIAHKIYYFTFAKNFYIILTVQIFIGILCFLCSTFLVQPWSYICGVILLLTASSYSIIEIDKRLKLKEAWLKINRRK